MQRRLCSYSLRIDRRGISPNDHLVKGILDVRELVRDAVEQLQIRLIFGEEERDRFLAQQTVFTECPMARLDRRQRLEMIAADAQIGPFSALAPAPGVAKPERREEVERRRPGAAVRGRGTNQNVVLRGLGVLDCDVEKTV